MKPYKFETFIEQHDYPCWCGSMDHKVYSGNLSNSHPFAALRCTECNTQRILPRALETEEDANELYNSCKITQQEETMLLAGASACMDRIIDTGASFMCGQTVLDIGCGYGHLIELICSTHGCTGLGIDTDERKINRARERNHASVSYESKLFNPGEITQKFDFVISCAVVEHVIDPVSFIRSHADALKPGGSLILLTPNADSLNYRILRSWWRELLSLGEHIYLFTPDSLNRCATEAGLDHATYVTGHDYFRPSLKISSMKAALITAWSFYREACKRICSVIGDQRNGDIICAHFKKPSS